jgi:hypothetical protein
MNKLYVIIITVLLYISSFAQKDLLPAINSEISGTGENGNIAYFKGDNRPFTGILVEYGMKDRV